MVKSYLSLFFLLSAFASALAQPLPFGLSRVQPLAAAPTARSGSEAYPQPQEFEARPALKETYTGTPGNWTLVSTTEMQYTPTGRFGYRATRATGSSFPQSIYSYSYNAQGWIMRRIYVSGGAVADSVRYIYTTSGPNNQITRIDAYRGNRTDTYRIVYNAAGKPDTLFVNSSISSTASRTIFSYDLQNIWSGYQTQRKQGATGPWTDQAVYSGLRLGREVTEYRPEWQVANAYDQGDLDAPPFIGGYGIRMVDSVPGLPSVRYSGSDVGGTLTEREDVELNGTWRTLYEQIRSVDPQQGNATEYRLSSYYLSGQQRYRYWVTNTNTYDAQGRLTEVVRYDQTSNYYIRDVYSQFAPLSTQKSLPQLLQTWPAPASNFLYVAGMPAGTPYTLQTLHGATILSGKLSTDTRIDLTTLPSGLYLLQAAGATARIVKE